MDADKSMGTERNLPHATTTVLHRANIAAHVRKSQVRAALFRKPEPVRIGRFTLLRCIGTGAMGEVYAAYDEQLDRKVALKLVRAELNSAVRAEQRLLREAQTLAQLSHPNVVHIYEVGTFQGRVFIAMEFVRGTTLTQWLESEAPRRRSQDEILRHFIAAGRGLEAAHEADLTHRDFKPDNVLVGDDGRVRVADFGLARAMDMVSEAADITETADITNPDANCANRADTHSDTSPETDEIIPVVDDAGQTVNLRGCGGVAPAPPDIPDMPAVPVPVAHEVTPKRPHRTQRKVGLRLTSTGTVVGTPRYMAPEQIRGQSADPRSDQFSFCVALYHALFNEWPFAGTDVREVTRSVLAGELALPKRSGEVNASVRKALMRGLSRDPQQRCPDMGTLLEVLEHAVRPSRSRWAIAVTSVALLAASAVTYFAITAVPNEPCAAVASEIDAAWTPIRKQAIADAFMRTGVPYAESTWVSVEPQISQYISDWRSEAVAACETVYVYQRESENQFDKRMLCLERGERSLMALLDSFERIDKDTIERAAAAASQLPDLTVCSNTENLVFGLKPPPADLKGRVAEIRRHLATASTHANLGRFQDALAIANAQLAVAKEVPYRAVHAEALYQVGRALEGRSRNGDIDRAENLLIQAINIAGSERHDELAAEVLIFLVKMAATHSMIKRGYAWSERAIAAVQRIGDQAYQRAQAEYALGSLLQKDGKYRQAATHLKYAIELIEGIPQRRMLLAGYYQQLANAISYLDDIHEAKKLYTLALTIAREELGEVHPRLVAIHRDIGSTLFEVGESDSARVQLETSLSMGRQIYGEDHYIVGDISYNLGNSEIMAGAPDRAHPYILTAQRIYDQILPADHVDRAYPLYALGLIALLRRNFSEALSAFEQSLEIRRRHLDDKHLHLVISHGYVAATLTQLGRYAEARTHLQRATEILNNSQSVQPGYQAWLLTVQGQIFLGQGLTISAIRVLEDAVTQFQERPSPAIDVAPALWALARALHSHNPAQTHERAIELAQQARSLYASIGQAGVLDRDDIDRWLERRIPSPIRN